MTDIERRFCEMVERLARFPGVSLPEAIRSVGPGWEELADAAWPAATDAGGRVLQVKEKFGLLRVYFDRVSPAAVDSVARRVDLLERKSWSVCEWCGTAGKCRDYEYMDALPEGAISGWVKTLCNRHAWLFYVDGRRWWWTEE